jgi:hypothetical protein
MNLFVFGAHEQIKAVSCEDTRKLVPDAVRRARDDCKLFGHVAPLGLIAFF